MNDKSQPQEKLLDLSHQVVKAFYTKKTAELAPLLDEEFLWIGGLSFQWTESPETFLRFKAAEPPSQAAVQISGESYTLRAAGEDSWVVCGHFLTTLHPGGKPLRFFIRVTLVWRRRGEQFSLLHLHSSHTEDTGFPLNLPEENGSFCQYVRSRFYEEDRGEKDSDSSICLKDESGRLHYLNPSEILYLKASNQWCHVVTVFERFLTFGSLTGFEKLLPDFLRIHRSYLVNLNAVAFMGKQELRMANGDLVPMSRLRSKEFAEAFRAYIKRTAR